MARITIDIDEDLIQKAILLTGARSKREAVEIALQRLLAWGSVHGDLRKLRGKLPWDGDLDRWRSHRR